MKYILSRIIGLGFIGGCATGAFLEFSAYHWLGGALGILGMIGWFVVLGLVIADEREK